MKHISDIFEQIKYDYRGNVANCIIVRQKNVFIYLILLMFFLLVNFRNKI